MLIRVGDVKILTTLELIKRKGDLDKLKSLPRNDIFVVLDNIRSAYNVGAIFRTCDAARIKKLYLCGITARPPRADIEKTSLKTIDWVPFEYHKNTMFVVDDLKNRGINVIALEQTDQSINYKKYDYKKPLALVLGNEVDGVSQDILNVCHRSIEIPMHGVANSLNITTALGIVLFHITK